MEQTDAYLARPVDRRMVGIIERFGSGYRSVLDLGCGSGLYGPTFRSRTTTLIGLDFDPTLCENARANGMYDSVVCGDVRALPALVPKVELVFASELLEHMTNEKIRDVVRGIEAVCAKRIIITVPNPLSPHFNYDPTHVLRYSIGSFLRTLNESKEFSYRLLPIGFSERNLCKPVYRALNVIASRIPIASPTVLYIGDRL